MAFGEKGKDLNFLFKRKVGFEVKTHFWKDAWFGDLTFRELFPTLYAVEYVKDCLLKDKVRVNAEMEKNYCWGWSKEHRGSYEMNQFPVISLRHLKDKSSTDCNDSFTWVGWIPFKINCFVWRMIRN